MMVSSSVSSKIGSTGRFLRVWHRVVVHWRAIVLLLILACVVIRAAHFDEFIRFDLILFALLLVFIASQIFWIGRILDLVEWFLPGEPRRVWLAIIAGVVYLFVFTYSYPDWGLSHVVRAADYPVAEHTHRRDILVVVRGIAVGLSASDCFRGGRPGGPRRWVGLLQSAHGYVRAFRRS